MDFQGKVSFSRSSSMKTDRMILALLACAAVLPPRLASAQQAPVITKQVPQEAGILTYRNYLAQLPGGAAPAAGTAESRKAELDLLAAQTNTIKALARRIDELEARVQQLEAGKKAGGAK
jgi:hypothetical protein